MGRRTIRRMILSTVAIMRMSVEHLCPGVKEQRLSCLLVMSIQDPKPKLTQTFSPGPKRKHIWEDMRKKILALGNAKCQNSLGSRSWLSQPACRPLFAMHFCYTGQTSYLDISRKHSNPMSEMHTTAVRESFRQLPSYAKKAQMGFADAGVKKERWWQSHR